MWNSNIGNELMQSADGRRDDNRLAEGIQQGMYSPPARTMPGDNHLQIKLPKILDCLWNDLLHLRPRQVEASHYAIERYWIEKVAGMKEHVDNPRVGASRKYDDAFTLYVDC